MSATRTTYKVAARGRFDPNMLGRLIGWMSPRNTNTHVELEPPELPPTPPAPSAPVTYETVLSEAIARHDAPLVAREQWMELVEDVQARPDLVPRVPTAFPAIAARMLDLLRDPDVGLNEIVGVVQRDAGIASSLLRVANSAAFAPPSPITTLRGAIAMLGAKQVYEIVMCSAGQSLYDVPSKVEVALFPSLWPTMFRDAIANAFTTGRLALDLSNASSERALILGLLADVGRPAALRVITRLVADRIAMPDEEVVAAALDAVAPEIGKQLVAAMGLPKQIHDAYLDGEVPEAYAARLIAAIGSIQRHSPRSWSAASEIRKTAEALVMPPLVVRMYFTQRSTYADQAAAMFG